MLERAVIVAILAPHIPGSIGYLMNITPSMSMNLDVLMNIFLNATYLILSVASIVVGSVYSTTFAIIVGVFKAGLSGVTIMTLALYLVYLLLNTTSSTLRGGEFRYMKFPLKAWLQTPLTLVIVTLPPLLLILYIAYYLTLFISSVVARQELLLNPNIAVILSSPIVQIAITLAGLVYVYMVSESIVDILSGFLKPSYTLSLQSLLDTRDLDVYFSPPLTWLLYASVASLIYAPVYVMIFDILLKEYYERLLMILPEFPTRYIVSIGLFLALLVVARYLYSITDPFEAPKRTLYASIAILLLLYASATKLAYINLGWHSLLQPDFEGLGRFLEEKFIDYSYVLISVIEAIFRLIGVAP